MSTQLDFLMQLYMMNLLQQQQQQQQKLLQQPTQPPTQTPKQNDHLTSSSTIIAPAETTATQENPQLTLEDSDNEQTTATTTIIKTRTKRNCSSSSSSCSPNSKFSCNTEFLQDTKQNILQKLLLDKLTPLAASSHVLLTPTTPNSSNCNLIDTNFKTNHLIQNLANFTHLNQSHFSAEQFLQSSTVTSTPLLNEVEHVDGNDANDDNDEDELEEDEDEDEKPLSSLYNSSGNATTSTSTAGTSGNGSAESAADSKMLMSGIQNLETTTDSMESLHMSNTPLKKTNMQFNQQFKDTPLLTHFGYEQEDSNINTPLLHAKALPTPPASETLTTQKNFQTTTNFSADNLLTTEENLKNLRKVSSYLECDNSLCRQENLREHFHCHEVPCRGKILSKKDDIIRHLKWHKKRKESLQLGFARFTSSDDCAPEYGAGCSYNWKQTHYHCIYEDCPKVYVSTSDVQMHANFHRKNTEIVQEGFRRFRAHENCKILDCPFYGKRISHYHCCREGCNHTFKNKADMDKHKTYHLKDYQLTQDGFKKILKTEQCPFDACKYSTVCNHIHCVRENCNYILHSSSQMISHKRKHDRLDTEQAYQHFKKEKDSSEEDAVTSAVPAAVNVTTPLSSISADHFLSRKRGRPPKKIQMPATLEQETKRFKLEAGAGAGVGGEQQQLLGQNLFYNMANSNFYPPFLPNFQAPTVNTLPTNETNTNTPNFQLTHLMALFQLQNPLFYQNLYPNDPSAANNMANILNAAGNIPINSNFFPHITSGVGGNNMQTSIKTEPNATNTNPSSPTNGLKTDFIEKQQQFNE